MSAPFCLRGHETERHAFYPEVSSTVSKTITDLARASQDTLSEFFRTSDSFCT